MSRHDREAGYARGIFRTMVAAQQGPEYVGRHRETSETWEEPVNQLMALARVFHVRPYSPFQLTTFRLDVFTGECTL